MIGPYIAIFTTILAIRLPTATGLIDGLFANPAIAWILGAVMVGGGLVIIGGHRNWRGPAAIAISVFGWFVLLRGVGLVATTSAVQDIAETATLDPTLLTLARVFFGLLALIGIWLTYVGWYPKPVKAPPIASTSQP
ncbi:hypothetical protein IMZ11_04760 [Microtetraspora sp. AC03309]|uniref:hypothetical protein n=1 Tax=Microtetraspora sp. AC03309 TaxID=2779376 RepID=UPI001E3C8D54|nr:hypothetical protein [Microtetraspora sp. AC03309]MCC5574949.1 hypothetical protein [Microtetraspora sp. AC03309]